MTATSRMAAAVRLGLLVIAVTGSGCSLLGPKMSEDGLAKVSSPGPGTLYMKPDHPVGSYDSILLSPRFGIHYATGQGSLPWWVERALVDRMVAGLQQGVDAEFHLASGPGPCTLQLGLYLTRLSFYEPSTGGAQTNFVNSYGSATLVFEFRDSLTDEALVRYGQKADLGSGVEGSVQGPNLDRLNRALDRMLENVGRKLQEVVPVAMEARAEDGCNGNLGRAVLEARDRSS